jgi:hypothetical protein
MCVGHHRQTQKLGHVPEYVGQYNLPNIDAKPRQPRPKCAVDGCEDEAKGRGLCSMHYQRMRTRGTTDDPEIRYQFIDREIDFRDPQGFDPVEAKRSVNLWQNVILFAFQDITNPMYVDQGDSIDRVKTQARAWFSFGNPDFVMACDLAFMDPFFIHDRAKLAIQNHDRLSRMIATYRDERRGYLETSPHAQGTGGGRRENSSDHGRRVIHFGVNNPLRNVEDGPCS